VDVLAVLDAAAMGAYRRGAMTGDKHYPGVREYEQARAAIAELIRAAHAVNVAITCGQHEDRINRSNPLSVETLRTALARVGGGK